MILTTRKKCNMEDDITYPAHQVRQYLETLDDLVHLRAIVEQHGMTKELYAFVNKNGVLSRCISNFPATESFVDTTDKAMLLSGLDAKLEDLSGSLEGIIDSIMGFFSNSALTQNLIREIDATLSHKTFDEDLFNQDKVGKLEKNILKLSAFEGAIKDIDKAIVYLKDSLQERNVADSQDYDKWIHDVQQKAHNILSRVSVITTTVNGATVTSYVVYDNPHELVSTNLKDAGYGEHSLKQFRDALEQFKQTSAHIKTAMAHLKPHMAQYGWWKRLNIKVEINHVLACISAYESYYIRQRTPQTIRRLIKCYK